MIKITVNPIHLYFISQKVTEIRGLTYTPLEFIKYMIDGINDNLTSILIDEGDGNKINGFVVMSVIEPIPQKKELFIDLAWIDPENKKLGDELMATVEETAKKLKLDKISTSVIKNDSAFCKKYNFKKESVILSKTINLEEKDDGKPNESAEGKD